MKCVFFIFAHLSKSTINRLAEITYSIYLCFAIAFVDFLGCIATILTTIAKSLSP